MSIIKVHFDMNTELQGLIRAWVNKYKVYVGTIIRHPDYVVDTYWTYLKPYDLNSRLVYLQLLDLHKADNLTYESALNVLNGHKVLLDSFINYLRCDECSNVVDEALEITITYDDGSCSTMICSGCLHKAIA